MERRAFGPGRPALPAETEASAEKAGAHLNAGYRLSSIRPFGWWSMVGTLFLLYTPACILWIVGEIVGKSSLYSGFFELRLRVRMKIEAAAQKPGVMR
jgi:hypothetical protein